MKRDCESNFSNFVLRSYFMARAISQASAGGKEVHRGDDDRGGGGANMPNDDKYALTVLLCVYVCKD